MREFYRDWGEMTAKAVAYLRSIIGGGLDDPGLVELVGELSLRSERFRTLWARQDVRQQTSGLTRLLHPQVGPLDLQYEKLALPGTPGQMLVTYHAEWGTESHERLLLLAHLVEQSRSDEGGTAPPGSPTALTAIRPRRGWLRSPPLTGPEAAACLVGQSHVASSSGGSQPSVRLRREVST